MVHDDEKCHWYHVIMMAMACHDLKNHVALHFIFPSVRNAIIPLMMLFTSCDTDASGKGINKQKSHFALHFNCLDLMNAMVPLTVLFAWCQCRCQWCDMTRKVMLHLILMVLTSGMQWCYCQHCPHHMVLTSMQCFHIKTAPILPMALCDANANVNSIIWQKSPVASHFRCFNLISAMVPLMLLLASCDNGIKWSKSCVGSHFNCPDLRNGLVPILMPLALCNSKASVSGRKWWKSHVTCHFFHLDLIHLTGPLTMPLVSCNAITGPNRITWPNNVMLHIFLIILS